MRPKNPCWVAEVASASCRQRVCCVLCSARWAPGPTSLSVKRGSSGSRRSATASALTPTSPMAVATAPIFDPDLDRQVADEVVTDLAARIGGKNVALTIVKRLPLMGGGVSAIMDGFATYQIGRYASGELLRRRALVVS